MHLLPILATACLAAAAQGQPVTAGDSPPVALPRARDGDIAIRQELDAAREAATPEAFDLFIARHPRHPLARTARRERDRLAKR